MKGYRKKITLSFLQIRYLHSITRYLVFPEALFEKLLRRFCNILALRTKELRSMQCWENVDFEKQDDNPSTKR